MSASSPTPRSPRVVASSDGVHVVVHDLGGEGPTVLLSHATGFHGRCYLPMAHRLADRYHSVAFDYRGHGDTPMPADVPIDWHRYGDDAFAVASSLDGPVHAFGHSMGGACLLMAAHRNPDLFDRLVLFEPIVFPGDAVRDSAAQSPLVAGARRRRSTFAGFDEAYANFASKPPLDAFTPEALDAYVRFGFRLGEDGQVHLRCAPETEAQTFERGAFHDTWKLLPEIEIPVLVVAGSVDETRPSQIAASIAEQLPRGEYRELPEYDHFAPMTHPAEMADLAAAFFG